jgi:hypothetical protein
MWILLVRVEPWRRLSGDFSHVLAIEAKNIFEKPCGAPINRRWIVFSEDDDK